MFDLQDFLVLALLAAAPAWWWYVSGQKAVAMRVAGAHCRQRDLQLLDQTLAFAHYRLQRDARGRPYVGRHYRFEFSTDGQDRHQGFLVMAGRHVTRIVLETSHTEVEDY